MPIVFLFIKGKSIFLSQLFWMDGKIHIILKFLIQIETFNDLRQKTMYFVFEIIFEYFAGTKKDKMWKEGQLYSLKPCVPFENT